MGYVALFAYTQVQIFSQHSVDRRLNKSVLTKLQLISVFHVTVISNVCFTSLSRIHFFQVSATSPFQQYDTDPIYFFWEWIIYFQ